MGESLAMYREWDSGQRHLAAGRYVAAREALQGAERMAWREGDWPSLARIHLPLLEARRQIRYQAAEGHILIGTGKDVRGLVKEFLQRAGDAGTLVIPVPWPEIGVWSRVVNLAAIRSGRRLEILILTRHRDAWRIGSIGDPTFAAGLPAQWVSDTEAAIGPSTDRALVVPLPPPMEYSGSAPGLGALARESLLISWEALALRWQRRHALRKFTQVRDEMGWLRRTLQVDPACEPVAMRLIALAEGAGRER